jgi:hypothetical protein
VNAPVVWERLLALIGPQTPAASGTPRPLPRPTPPPPDTVLITPPPAAAAHRAPAPRPPLVTPPPRDEALLDRQLAELKARLRAEGKL